ncbi:D-glycero-beta-D-manno-heptose-7-phosphate kinase [Helicobacter sp.]|uniref:D-glycero-beta-D-manno-heptose-7-phosphate kinase n=1 Tax=Helicobacter sp. TaxID=218 RepID=UPI0025B8B319|nr:D-glycero-beta-D-manno-heptose-7-phosphate kinase [Helicobacter sp.]MCI5968847.1 D-glycero-beta-D-manno-heptose-7-phosphate kinase [Helicobacter sp.]MDY2585032.1 D-glycero-beta-D-manno-heptose-7-phosphate kinase [Helicobacter sp.]
MKPKILVVGDLILDHYIWGNCERISPEAPVQVIDVKKESLNLGGACNVASNLVGLDSSVWICGIAGKDEAGSTLKAELEKLGIHTDGIFFEKNRPTTQKSRIIAGHQQVVRVDREDKTQITKEAEAFILKFTEALILDSNIACVVLSDYQKGVLSVELTQRLIALAKSKGVKILADPKGRDYTKYKGATLLTPNKKEATEATSITIGDEASLKEALVCLQDLCDLEISLITLSEDGIAFRESAAKEIKRIPTIAREVFDVTGAGDTVIASLAYMLALGKPISQSVYFANAAAAVVVSKLGSATASKQEILAHLKRNNLLDSTLANAEFLKIFDVKQENFGFNSQVSKILKRKVLNFYRDKWIQQDEFIPFLKTLEKLKQEGFKVIFTNGCFDLLHLGHLDYLHKARKLGDLLIVGLNNDASIKRLKGNARPVNCQRDRIAQLCALECVDFVVVFDTDTPEELIAKIRPDVLVKGADYKNKEVVGAKFSKEVRLIDFVEGKSTTNLIQKIKNL